MSEILSPQPLPERTRHLKGISERTITEHYKLYEGYVNKVNETRQKLAGVDATKGNATYSEIRALKRGESYALDGAKLHELYFEQLGAETKPPKELMRAFEGRFGSYAKFQSEFVGSGLSARGWAILAYDDDHQELFIYITDDQHDGHVISCTPILVLDVFEHAYYIDYGTNRRGYIDAFFKNLDWSIVERRYREATRVKRPRLRIL